MKYARASLDELMNHLNQTGKREALRQITSRLAAKTASLEDDVESLLDEAISELDEDPDTEDIAMVETMDEAIQIAIEMVQDWADEEGEDLPSEDELRESEAIQQWVSEIRSGVMPT